MEGGGEAGLPAKLARARVDHRYGICLDGRDIATAFLKRREEKAQARKTMRKEPNESSAERPNARQELRGPGVRRASLGIFLICVLFLAACDSPSFVDVGVINETEYSTDVSVQSSPAGASLELGFVGPRSEREFQQVIDQGESWIFTFDHFGVYAESLTISRDDLERAEWRVDVPESYAETLRDMGQVPSP